MAPVSEQNFIRNFQSILLIRFPFLIIIKMTSSGKIFKFFIPVLLSFSSLVLTAQNQRTWDVFEITLKSSAVFQNPYTEGLKRGEKAFVSGVFTGTAGTCAGKRMTVPGFWDGADVWKIRFAPPIDGTWSYETVSADKKMNGKKGRSWLQAGQIMKNQPIL